MCFIPMYLWRQHVPIGMAQPGETHESVISTKIQLTWFSLKDLTDLVLLQGFPGTTCWPGLSDEALWVAPGCSVLHLLALVASF